MMKRRMQDPDRDEATPEALMRDADQDERGRSALGMAAGGAGDEAEGGPMDERAMLGQLPPEMLEQIKAAYQVGANVLYNKEVFGQLVQGVDRQDPTRVLALVLLKVVDGVDQKLGGLDVNVLLAVAMLLLGDVVDALQQTGRGPFTADQVQQALAMMVKEWLAAHGDRVPPEQLQQFAQQAGFGAPQAPGGAAGPAGYPQGG